jgi:LmbE family N-acetylglucosaminyl deacetylase
MMKSNSNLIFKKVLCLAPHPDDAELSFSGTVKKNKKTRFDIYIMSMGNEHEKLAGDFRYREIENFWKEYKCDNIKLINSNIPYVSTLSEDAWITKIENEVNILDYDCVLIPPYEDFHWEHKIVNKVGSVLCRSSPISLIEYRTPSTKHEWAPNMFVDIDKYFNFKAKCVEKCFKKQIDFGRDYFLKENLSLFCSDYLSSLRGLKHVEQFKIKLFFGG